MRGMKYMAELKYKIKKTWALFQKTIRAGQRN